MAAGRPSKPIEVHKLQGTYRPDRHGNTIQADKKKLEPPEYLSGLARAEWIRMSEELYDLGITTHLDYSILEQYCVTYALWRKTLEEIKEHGIVQETSTGYTQQTGHFTALSKLAKDLREISREIGVTPAARSRMKLAKEQEKEEGIESTLSRLAKEECKK